jgi:hypothetical protein
VFDVSMAEPKLQSSRIVASVGQQVPACVSKHVWVDGWQSGSFASGGDHCSDVIAAHSREGSLTVAYG